MTDRVPNTPLRIGILGAGAFASRRHLPDLAGDARVEVAAACRRSPEELARFCDHFGIARRYQEWTAMLDEARLDGVLIATPHDQHYPQAKAALEHGLHVLLEKPMALHVEEAEELVALARERGRVLAVAFNPPYWRHTSALRDSLGGGRIGALEAAEFFWSTSAEAVFGKAPMPETMPGVVRPTLFRADPAANGGGALMDAGGHLLSELLWVTGKRALEVIAIMDKIPDDMRAVVSVRLEGDIPATITLVANSRSPERRVRSAYYGDAGAAVGTGMPFRVQWSGARPEGPMDEADLPPAPTPAGDWIGCILNGGAPRGSAEHALAVTRLLAAAYRSAESGGAVRL